MKKAAIIIISSALLLAGCGSAGVNNTMSSTGPETASVSSENEAGAAPFAAHIPCLEKRKESRICQL